MYKESKMEASLGLSGAIGVGVGAIVGGGILALAGVAFTTTGPGAMVAFALNGLIAILTALSFAEMSAAFPESGGTYTFAKKVLSVRAAFLVGWVVWFASIVAAVLYALGFASFAVIILEHLWQAMYGAPSQWLTSRSMVTIMAVSATALYTFSLIRKSAGGGQWVNIGKVVVFGVLIAGGLWALIGKPVWEIQTKLRPFFPGGALGLFQAMGYTFIALQGFDLIAAVAGEVRDPGRNIPRAMLSSLGIALAIYLPLLFIIATVGVQPGQSITTLSAEHPETIVAVAAENYLGHFGYWLVMVAAIFSMLSALQANLFAASRVALTMGRDRTLSHLLEGIHEKHGTPTAAILATALIVITILLVVPDVASAGAASSLIFLITFALAHRINILARHRGGSQHMPFRVPWFPLVPIVGGLACLALAIFQGFAVPSAGLITTVWLGFGGILYLLIFSRRAQVVDASAEALDPQLVRLRGKSPLVLVPIANPANAEAMVGVANALAPPNMGRVLLLSVVAAPKEWQPDECPRQLLDAQAVLRESLTASFLSGMSPEALTTIAPRPWPEIIRVSRIHRCESILLGFSNFTEEVIENNLEQLMGKVDCDVVVLRAPPGWRLSEVRHVLVPVGGRNVHDQLRARLLGSICRTGRREITFLKIMSEHTSREVCNKARQALSRFAREEVRDNAQVIVLPSNDVAEEITRYATKSDLVILGLQRLSRRRKVFGDITLRIARDTSCGIIMINRRG